MPERSQPSDLVEIARRNGDFRQNYGLVIGAFLYLRSLNAVSRRSLTCTGVILGLIAVAWPWISKRGRCWPS